MTIILLPQALPDVSLQKGDPVTLRFTQKLTISCNDPTAFNPPVPNGKLFLAGEHFDTTVVSRANETVVLSWFLPFTSGSMPRSLSGFRTIHITSGGAKYRRRLQDVFEEDPQFKRLFFRCLPNTKLLLEALIKHKLLPLPRFAIKQIRMILKAGESME